MSLPEFPTITPPLSREDAINQIISSIAMEELGLSHIINAEGEKLQYVLGTLSGVTGPSATIDDILKVNESVRAVLQGATESQTLLRSKLQQALNSGVLTGPTGPQGPQGPTTITFSPDVDTLDPNTPASVENVGTEPQNHILKFGIPRGVTGATGPAATAVGLSVLNNGGATIDAAATGTPIPLPVSAHNEGFTAIGTTAFTVINAGNYLVSYSIRTMEALTGSSSAVFLGDREVVATKVAPAVSDNFYNTSIVAVLAGSTLSLRLSGANIARLQNESASAALTVVKLS